MIYCPKCNDKYSFLSRLKSVNYSTIECKNCKTKYKMKNSNLVIFINTFLICVISPMLKSYLPKINFLSSLIRDLTIVIISCFTVFFILSYFVKYQEIND